MNTCEAESSFENGEIELDESYFGARCGRDAKGKIPVFGMLKRSDKVYTGIDAVGIVFRDGVPSIVYSRSKLLKLAKILIKID